MIGLKALITVLAINSLFLIAIPVVRSGGNIRLKLFLVGTVVLLGLFAVLFSIGKMFPATH